MRRVFFLAFLGLSSVGCAQMDKYNRCYEPPLPEKQAVAYADGSKQARGEIVAAARRSADAIKPKKKESKVIYQVQIPGSGEQLPVEAAN